MTQASHLVHFGGPDFAPGKLRDLLAERIAAVPAGGAIDWVTYYFRDRRLAAQLLEAQRRGVAVRVTIEGHPRAVRANDAVIHLLSAPGGLGPSFRVVEHARLPYPRTRPRLHEKLYCFSHPVPHAFVGSFNPSGDVPEDDPDIREAIRDQDRGHNLLVEIRDSPLVAALAAHARHVHAARHTLLERLSHRTSRTLRSAALAIHLSPGLRANAALRLLRLVGAGSRVRIVASHLRGSTAVKALVALAGRGAAVHVLAEHTETRVPEDVVRQLREARITVQRVAHPEGLPMHNKFILVEAAGQRTVMFGSVNLTERSLRANHEICVVSSCSELFAAFEGRWEALAALSMRKT